MIQNKLRNKLYWFSEILKGNKVGSYLKEINFLLNNPESNQSKNIQEKNLNAVLKHAVNTTPFYNKYKENTSIFDFPVIKKTVIQNNFEDFQSYPFKNKNNFKVSTSGSTGVPFFLYQDKNKRSRNKADLIHFFKRSNFEVGNRLFNLAIWKKLNRKSDFACWAQNITQFDISKLTDKRIAKLLELIKQDNNSSKSIMGYVSALETVIQYVEKNKLNLEGFNLKSIITFSEHLSSTTKAKLKSIFKTEVFSRYSSEEIGIVAHQTINSPDTFIVNHASYYIEVLDLNSDTPVKPGEYGRIIVTDLFNFAMPIIRYDTGDVAKLKILNNGVIAFEEIQGRKLDLLYDTQDNIISSHLFYTKVYKYYKLIKQYQFIQHGKKDYEVKLNLQEDSFLFEKELIESIKNDFGNDANIRITYVDEIPTLASGKRRKVINNYKKQNN